LDLKRKIQEIRINAIEGIAEAGSGHPGASFSAAEIMGVLYFRELRHDSSNPTWTKRDYFINSKGHSAPGYYATLAVAGYFPKNEMKDLRKFGSRLQGHPVRYSKLLEHHSVPGVEYSGGSEGIGLSVSIGIALANVIDNKDNNVYVLLGDGETNEGQVWEAAMTAPKFKLDNLVAILDRNKIQQDGFTEDIMPLDPVRDKWVAFNWNVIEINGHKVEQIMDALNKASEIKDKPTIIIANTVKGNGIKHMANNPQWHGKAPHNMHIPLLIEELEGEYMIAPSIIAGEKENYEEKIKKVERGGADMIHLDVMDGIFVPNVTFLADTIKKLRPITNIPFDAHLMIDKPYDHIEEYINAGCDIITIHAETCDNEKFCYIREKVMSAGISLGIAINPQTELPDWIFSYLNDIDVIIVMSVNPGFSGQKFIPDITSKISKLNKTLKMKGYKGYIEADGGIDASTVQRVYDAGARIMVAGSAVFSNSDINTAILQLKHKTNVTLERNLLKKADENGIRKDWIIARKHILIPVANELGIEDEINKL
ncbi:MAG TPA: ribulose-phosphate 3-epimerase, partial [Candidatus Nitrosocosmicus sp.]|nr:ribulose-phosphate 3-epimerase [Candidatus Nitrosocosmicus sp.]